MFFFFGDKTRAETLGVVGDECPACDRVRAFTVEDVYTAPHIYYIAYSSYHFQARVRYCWTCGNEFYARLKDYECLIPEDDAEEMSLKEIVRRTNPRLAAAIEGRARSEPVDRDPDRRSRPDDDRDEPCPGWSGGH